MAKSTKAKRQPAPKAAKKAPAEEPADRLPGSIDDLKSTKGGLVSYLFLTGKDRDAIAKELKAAFKLSDVQSVKIVRRITGRVRFFQRAQELLTAK